MMDDIIEHYRERARQCAELAKKAISVEERDQILKISESWLTLARQREKYSLGTNNHT